MRIRTGYEGRDDRGRPTRPTWTENVPTLDLAVYPQTPLERRVLTPEELAQRAAADAERSRPVLPAPRPAPRAIPADAATLRHSVRVTDPAPSGNLAEPTTAPAPVHAIPSQLEESPVTVTPDLPAYAPPSLPCRSCLHEPVCALKAHLADEGFDAPVRELAPGLRLVSLGVTVDCDHHLASLKPVAVEPIRAERPGESWRTASINELEPKRHPSKKGEAAEKAERAARVLAAVARHGGDRRAAALELGMKANALAMVLKFASLHAVDAGPEAVAS